MRCDHARSIAQLYSRRPDDDYPGAQWDAAPDLVAADLRPLAQVLTCASAGAIVFTDRALSEWKASNDPRRQKMHGHLIRLAQAAVAWRKAGGSVGERLEGWFRAQ